MTHIFDEKKSAQISILSTAIDRKTMFPVDWCAQIDFFIFLKKIVFCIVSIFCPDQPHVAEMIMSVMLDSHDDVT